MGREARINKKLTRKQTAFVKVIVEGKPATQAAMIAYDVSNPKTASVIASQNLNKLSIKEAIDEALRLQGLTLDVIAVNIGEIANAKPEKVSGDTVLKANVELLKLRGAYPDKKSLQVSYSMKSNLASDFSGMTVQEMRAEVAKMRAENDEILDEIEESESRRGYTTQTDLSKS